MRILLVCLGNICRSPAAEAALRAELDAAGLADQVEVDSAGTGDWNLGRPPDPRMVSAAAAGGLTLSGSARLITADDFRDSDLILVMDRANLAAVQALAPDQPARDKVRLFLSLSDGRHGDEVPDPYFGDDAGFAHVVDVVRDGAAAVVAALRAQVA